MQNNAEFMSIFAYKEELTNNEKADDISVIF